MAAGFVQALRRHSAEVQALEGDQAAEFLRLLRTLQNELQGRLLAIGGATNPVTAFNLQRVLGETQSGILTLEAKARDKYDKASAEATDLAIEHIGDELDRLSLAFDAKHLDVTIDAASALADPAQHLLANHFGSSVSRYGLDLLNGVRQRLFVALRTGDAYGAVVKDIASERGPFGTAGRNNAERLVRTEVSQAYGAAQHHGIFQAAKQVPTLKKVWLHVGSWLCPTCGPLHGTERPIDGTWTIKQGKKTKQVAHAPAHPNCSCRVASMKSSWRTQMRSLGYLGDQPATGEQGAARL